MNGLLLRLAGPLQSWGERAAFNHRDTAAHPTRSALIGMLAAAQGRPRSQALAPYQNLPGAPTHHDLTFTIRIDQPGTLYRDYHTVGGGRPARQGLRTAAGGYRTADKSTLVTHRDYLTGACFAVAVQGPAALLDLIADTLEHPVWAPYLGRKACPPDEPLLLRAEVPDPVHELLTRVPLTLPRPPAAGADSTAVDVVWEQRPDHHPHHQPDLELSCEPADLTRHNRSHLPRPLWRTTERVPAALYAGPHPIDALTRYILAEDACPPH